MNGAQAESQQQSKGRVPNGGKKSPNQEPASRVGPDGIEYVSADEFFAQQYAEKQARAQQPQAAPQAQPQPAPQAQPQAAPQAQPQAAPQAQPQPVPQAQPQAAPQAQPQAASWAQPQPAPWAQPQPTPQAQPQQPWGVPPMTEGQPSEGWSGQPQAWSLNQAPQWGPSEGQAGAWGPNPGAWGNNGTPAGWGAAPAPDSQDAGDYAEAPEEDEEEDHVSPMDYLAQQQDEKKSGKRIRRRKPPADEDDKKRKKFKDLANMDGYYDDRRPLDNEEDLESGRNIAWVPLILGVIGIGLFAFVVIQLQSLL